MHQPSKNMNATDLQRTQPPTKNLNSQLNKLCKRFSSQMKTIYAKKSPNVAPFDPPSSNLLSPCLFGSK